MKTVECGECNMKFHSIGTLSAGKRVKHHKKIEHKFECENCGYRFVSTTHIAVHKFLSHDIMCCKCGETCEGNCLESFTNELEKAGEEEVQRKHEDLKDIIDESEKNDNGFFLNS